MKKSPVYASCIELDRLYKLSKHLKELENANEKAEITVLIDECGYTEIKDETIRFVIPIFNLVKFLPSFFPEEWIKDDNGNIYYQNDFNRDTFSSLILYFGLGTKENEEINFNSFFTMLCPYWQDHTLREILNFPYLTPNSTWNDVANMISNYIHLLGSPKEILPGSGEYIFFSH